MRCDMSESILLLEGTLRTLSISPETVLRAHVLRWKAAALVPVSSMMQAAQAAPPLTLAEGKQKWGGCSSWRGMAIFPLA